MTQPNSSSLYLAYISALFRLARRLLRRNHETERVRDRDRRYFLISCRLHRALCRGWKNCLRWRERDRHRRWWRYGLNFWRRYLVSVRVDLHVPLVLFGVHFRERLPEGLLVYLDYFFLFCFLVLLLLLLLLGRRRLWALRRFFLLRLVVVRAAKEDIHSVTTRVAQCRGIRILYDFNGFFFLFRWWNWHSRRNHERVDIHCRILRTHRDRLEHHRLGGFLHIFHLLVSAVVRLVGWLRAVYRALPGRGWDWYKEWVIQRERWRNDMLCALV